MKKQLVVILTLVFVLAAAQASFAAQSVFSDVPAKHWSYDAVSKLVKAGVLDGYSDGTFKGEKPLSRYEMAIVVARAMTKLDKADAENKALIEKLAAEFKTELDSFGVRLATVEQKADKFSVSGTLRANYQSQSKSINGNDQGFQNDGQNRYELCLEGKVKVDDIWTAHFYNETSHFYGGEAVNANGDGTNPTWKRIWADGKIGNVNANLGKSWLWYGYSNTIGIEGNGVQFTFNNPSVNTQVFMFKPSWGAIGSNDYPTPGVRSGTNMYGVNFNAPVSANTNVNLLIGGNHRSDANTLMTSWGDIGFDTKFAKDFKFTVAYGRTNAATYNHNYLVRLDYKGADQNVPGTYGITLRYMDRQVNGAPCGDDEDGSYEIGYKNLGLEYSYILAKNVVWSSRYVHKTDAQGLGVTKNLFRTRIDFNF